MRKNAGITLVALVVTIIVLIILAGVSINLILGPNGIIAKAKEAKLAQEIGEIKEKLGLDILEAQMEAIERNEKLEQSQLEDIISNYGELQDDKNTIVLKDEKGEITLVDVYGGTTTTTGSYTENKAKIAMLESQVELLEKQKQDLQKQLEELANSEGDQAQRIVELTEQIQTLEDEKNTLEQNLEVANKKVEEYNNLQQILEQTTATSDKILKDYKAYSNGQLVTGTMENRGTLNWNPTTSTTETLLPGYYSGGTLSTQEAYNAGYNAAIADGATSANVKTIFSNGAFNTTYLSGFDTKATVSTTGIQVTNNNSLSASMIDLTNINFLFLDVSWSSSGTSYPNTWWWIRLYAENKSTLLSYISGEAHASQSTSSDLKGSFNGLVAFNVTNINEKAWIRLDATIANSTTSKLIVKNIYAI